MHKVFRSLLLLIAMGSFSLAPAQIDPEKRQLIQAGYNQPIEGKGPLAAYAFYYRNDPEFLSTNVALRLAIAPVYVDAEFGIRRALGEQTDLGVGLAGGGFADSYYEVRNGALIDEESFTGHGGEFSISAYHLFNHGQLVPLTGVIRLSPHYSVYERDSDTSRLFELPDDRLTLKLRTGFRWGGREPTILPDLGMELSIWHESQFRSDSGRYGFNNDRRVEFDSHLFWARALFIYTLPRLKHHFSVNLTGGTSVDADRFSAYRLGGVLPLSSEFPLTLPGYYWQEISARHFGLLSGEYTLPLDDKQRWNLSLLGSIAHVEFLRGLELPDKTHGGIGGGVRYRAPKNLWQVYLGYGYGFNAVRNHGKGAQSVGILFQLDLEARHRTTETIIDIEGPYKSRGLFRIFGN